MSRQNAQEWIIEDGKPFVHNDIQMEVILIIGKHIDIDYASWPARQLYYDLSKGQKEKIKKILDKLHNPEI